MRSIGPHDSSHVAAIGVTACACALIALAWISAGCSPMPELPTVVEAELIGENYEWHLELPGPDGTLGTADDIVAGTDLKLPRNTHVRLHLTSRDYIYVFRIPNLELSEMAIPDLAFTLEFNTGSHEVLAIRGDQLCGFRHESLEIPVHVESWSNYRQWVKATTL